MNSFCINLLYFYLCYCFITIFFVLLKNISESTKEFSDIKYKINENNHDKFFVTNKLNGYDQKYYIQGNYLHSIINNNDTCLNSCMLWVHTTIPPNTFAVTGFNVLYINEKKCECKGQILEKKIILYNY